MGFLAGLILNGLLTIASSLAGRALIGLGFGLVTYTGVSASLGWLKTMFIQSVAGLPSQVVGMLAFMGVGSFVSLIFSALIARQLLNGLQGDTVKKWVTK